MLSLNINGPLSLKRKENGLNNTVLNVSLEYWKKSEV
jgi:hypothetical protein